MFYFRVSVICKKHEPLVVSFTCIPTFADERPLPMKLCSSDVVASIVSVYYISVEKQMLYGVLAVLALYTRSIIAAN